MEDIHQLIIVKILINLYIISAMDLDETFMLHPLKVAIVILSHGEISQDLSSEIH
jgi:hypothetical protein